MLPIFRFQVEAEAPENLDVNDMSVLVAAESCAPQPGSAGSAGSRAVDRPDASEHFTLYTAPNGVQVMVRKSTLCCRLSEGSRVSADRLLRVQEGRDGPSRVAVKQPQAIERAQDLAVSHWCAFKETAQATTGEILVGRVLSFKFLTGGTASSRQYSGETAPVTSPSVGCLCSWFAVREDGTLDYLPADHRWRPINWYLFTVPPPQRQGKRVFYEEFVANSIQNYRL